MKLENHNPTETEKLLFRYYGLYLVETSEWTVKYAPTHTDNKSEEFPYVIENINTEMIEWDNAITFDKMSETVSMNSFYDIDGIILISNRMEELEFRKTFTKDL